MTINDFETNEHNTDVQKTFVSNDTFHYNGNGLDFDFKYVISTATYEENDGYDRTSYMVDMVITKDYIHPTHRKTYRKELKCGYHSLLYRLSFSIRIKMWDMQEAFSEKTVNRLIKRLETCNLDYQMKINKRYEKFKGIIEGTDFQEELY